mgnify:CR=1 FL=1
MTMISEFPLFLFTTLGGLAAGAYVAAAIFPDVDRKPKRPWLFPLVCLALLGVGLLGVLGHLGRPERFLLAMSNPSSMIAEEAYWSIAFGALMLVDFVLLLRRGASPRAVRVVAAVAAGALMCIMGWVYFTSYGNPAWAAWQTLPLFVLGDLAMGSALWALMREGAYRSDAFAAAFAVLGALAVASIALIAAHFAGLGYGALPFAAAVVLVVLVLMNRNHIYSLVPYLLVGAVLWYCVFMSGVHSTIAGVLLAFVIPSGSRVNLKSFITWSGDKVREARDAFQPETPVIAQGDYIKTVTALSRVAGQVVPPATRLEHKLYPWVYFGILPLFALTNADVSFIGMDVGAMLADPVLYGVMLGLLLGKPLGIMLMSFIIVKSKLASLPENVNWFHMLGASILGGVGFTMAIFVANLAYTDEMHIATAKLAILAASLLAGVLGFVFLLLQAKAAQKRGVAYVSASSDDVARQTAGSEVARESEELLRGIEDHPAIKSELEAAKKRGGVFEIVVDLGPTGLLGGGSIGDVREAVRNEVVRVLKEEGKDDLLEKVQEDFNDEGKPPLLSVEEALLREGGEEALRRALHHEEEDVEGVSGDTDSRNER